MAKVSSKGSADNDRKTNSNNGAYVAKTAAKGSKNSAIPRSDDTPAFKTTAKGGKTQNSTQPSQSSPTSTVKSEKPKEEKRVTSNILFDQWKAAAYGDSEQLENRLEELDNKTYTPTRQAAVERSRERKAITGRLEELNNEEEENPTFGERVSALIGSWGKGTGASYINTAGNINEMGTSAEGMERDIADLEAQVARAQTAYDETVREYGEEGAAVEKMRWKIFRRSLTQKKLNMPEWIKSAPIATMRKRPRRSFTTPPTSFSPNPNRICRRRSKAQAL